MTNEEKLEELKKWMRENKIPYLVNHFSRTTQTLLPIKVRKYRIAVRIGDDDEFFQKVKRTYHPIFIRDTDTAEFVIEKMQNTITKSMLYQHKRMLVAEQKEKNRAMEREKEKRHQEKLIEKEKRREEMKRLKEERDRKKAEEKAAKEEKERRRIELQEPPKRKRQRIGVRYEKA